MRRLVAFGAVVAALTVAAPAAQAADLTIEGTPSSDTIDVWATTPDSGTYQINGGSEVPFTGVSSMTIDGGAGNDHILLDSVGPTANPTLFAPPGGIRVNGGGDSDVFSDWGGAATDGSYDHVPADGAGTATITHTGAAPQKIVLDGVEQTQDLVLDQTWTYHGTPGPDNVQTVDGGLVGTRTGAVCCYPPHLLNNGDDVVPSFKSKVVIDTKGTDSTPDVVDLSGYEPLGYRPGLPADVVVDDGLATPEDVVHLNYHPSIEGPPGSTLSVRAARVDGAVSFTGAALGIDAPQVVPDSGTLQARVDNLEIETASPLAIANDHSLQAGGVSQSLSGVRSSGGPVSIDVPGKLSITPGDEVKGSDVTLTSDQIANPGRVAAPAGTVHLVPRGAGTPVALGPVTDPAGTYALSGPELQGVAAPRIVVGATWSGPLTVSAPISPRADLALESGGGFTASPGGAIQAQSLSLRDGTGTGRSWAVGPATVQASPGAAIPYAVAGDLSLAGGYGADSFDVTPSPVTRISIFGGDPSTTPGDSLTYESPGRPVSGDTTPPDGSIGSPGMKPVGFGGIEQLSIAP